MDSPVEIYPLYLMTLEMWNIIFDWIYFKNDKFVQVRDRVQKIDIYCNHANPIVTTIIPRWTDQPLPGRLMYTL